MSKNDDDDVRRRRESPSTPLFNALSSSPQSINRLRTLGRRQRPQRDAALSREDPGLHCGLGGGGRVGHGGLEKERERERERKNEARESECSEQSKRERKKSFNEATAKEKNRCLLFEDALALEGASARSAHTRPS